MIFKVNILLKKHLHAIVHPFAIGSNLLVLQPSLDQVQREHTCYANYASDATVDDLRQETAMGMGLMGIGWSDPNLRLAN